MCVPVSTLSSFPDPWLLARYQWRWDEMRIKKINRNENAATCRSSALPQLDVPDTDNFVPVVTIERGFPFKIWVWVMIYFKIFYVLRIGIGPEATEKAEKLCGFPIPLRWFPAELCTCLKSASTCVLNRAIIFGTYGGSVLQIDGHSSNLRCVEFE